MRSRSAWRSSLAAEADWARSDVGAKMTKSKTTSIFVCFMFLSSLAVSGIYELSLWALVILAKLDRALPQSHSTERQQRRHRPLAWFIPSGARSSGRLL